MKTPRIWWWLLSTLTAAAAASACAVGSTPDSTSAGPVSARSDAGRVDAGGTLNDFDSSVDDGNVAMDDEGGAVDAAIDAPIDTGPTSPCAFVGTLVTYDLSTVVGTSDLPATTTASSVSATSLTRAGVTAVSSSGAMNSNDWSTGAVDTSKRYVLSVAPLSGCKVTITSLSIDLKASGTGPTMAAIGTSVDAYAALKTVAVSTAGGAATIPIAGVSGATAPVEVHVFGYNAGGSAGTMRIEGTLSVTGSVSP